LYSENTLLYTYIHYLSKNIVWYLGHKLIDVTGENYQVLWIDATSKNDHATVKHYGTMLHFNKYLSCRNNAFEALYRLLVWSSDKQTKMGHQSRLGVDCSTHPKTLLKPPSFMFLSMVGYGFLMAVSTLSTEVVFPLPVLRIQSTRKTQSKTSVTCNFS